ncbi:MAG: gliding motility-associated C-terminal domain-containing protein [Bacteroidota bacterium]
MRINLFLFFLLAVSPKLWAQVQAPTLFCIKGDSLIYQRPFNLCGDFNALEIYGSQTRTGPYELLGSITDLDEFAFEHNTPGDEVWYYYMQSNLDCPSVAVLSSDTLNNLPPDVSPLISVSVENELVFLNWERSLSPQAWGYIIYRVTDLGTTPVDTVAFGTSFVDIFANPNEQSERYFVNALDQCGNVSAFVASHQTIFLTTDISPCNQAINLNWNLYQNWEGGIEAHEVWVSKDSAAAERVAVIPGDAANYTFTGAEDGVTYDFFVRALQRNTGVSAKSNVANIRANVVNSVGDLLVKNVTFTDDNQLELLWEWNPEAELLDATFFASTDNISFEEVGTPSILSPLDNPATFQIAGTAANEGKIFYRLNTTDRCDSTAISNYVSTIFLTTTVQANQTNELMWTPYDSRIGTVNTYGIYKSTNNDPPEFLARIDGSMGNFSDPITSSADAAACYYVEAEISVTFAQSGLEDYISRSNTVCLSPATDIVMPNAFAPRGTNQVFKPTILFDENIQNYQLLIYNRYGGKIFESTNPALGWNGQSKGKDAPMGAYTYLVRIEQANGNQLEKGGVLMLLR